MDADESPERRATELLERFLPEPQWARFNETGVLEVSGSRGMYRISVGDQTRLVDAQTGRAIATTCLQLSVPAPAHDRIIAEYMLIVNDEDYYWRTANVFPAQLGGMSPSVFFLGFLDIVLFTIFIVRLG